MAAVFIFATRLFSPLVKAKLPKATYTTACFYADAVAG